MSRRGRPRKPPAEHRRSCALSLHRGEQEELDAAAEAAELSRTAYVLALVRAAGPEGGRLDRELDAMRAERDRLRAACAEAIRAFDAYRAAAETLEAVLAADGDEESGP
jgi:hypothetical protein